MSEGQAVPKGRRGLARASLFIPLAVFLLVLFTLWRGFSLGDPSALPSALINQPLPEFELPLLDDMDRVVSSEAMHGEPFLLNVWATWCPTCRAEHAELARIAETYGVRIFGLNYKDRPEEARRWLERYGDPYIFSVVDRDGLLGIDLGVYGAPETFVVDSQGVIRFKRVGAVDQRVWENQIQPVLEEIRKREGNGASS